MQILLRHGRDVERQRERFGWSIELGNAIDDRGNSHLIWGEGLNWDSPGSIWYARGR